MSPPPDIDELIADLRRLSGERVGDALTFAEQEITRRNGPDSADPSLVYLCAELNARAGRAHEALDLIDAAQRSFRRADAHLEAERCEIGRAAVLEDLGRIDEAVEAATRQLERLAALPRDHQVVDVELRALVNRGVCHETVGRTPEALADFDAAAADAVELGDALTGALVQINRANVLDALGRTSEAIEGLTAARAVLAEHGDRDDRAKVAINIAGLRCRRGEFDLGLAEFETAEALVEQGTVDQMTVAVEIADALLAVGAVDAAVDRLHDALAAVSDTPISWLEGRAWLSLGEATTRSGSFGAARTAFGRAIDVFTALGNRAAQATALIQLAAIEVLEGGHRDLAIGEATSALALADPEHLPVQTCLAELRLAELVDSTTAERHLRSALRIARRLGLAPLLLQAEQQLGAHLVQRRRFAEAEVHVRAAVQLAETLRRRLRHGALLRAFPSRSATCFDDLVEICLAKDDLHGAAIAADRARSRSLLEAGVVPLVARATGDAARALEGELHAIYDRLLGISEQLDSTTRARLEAHCHDLERQLDRLEFDASISGHTGGAQVTSTADASPIGVPAAGSDVALVVEHEPHGHHEVLELTYVVRSGAIDLVVERDGTVDHWYRNIASLSDVMAEMQRFHADGRRAFALRSAGVAVPDQVITAAHARMTTIGTALLAPIADRLATDHVAISPIGPLAEVPFGALMVDGRRLIDQTEVTICPSHSVRQRCESEPRRQGSIVLVGLDDGGLTSVDSEIDQIEAIHRGAIVMRSRQAGLDAVVAAADGAAVLHLATHGMFRADAPLRSGVRLHDGWLTAARVASLDLHGATVVLSACDTGRSRASAGHELLGLQYGFLAAGARHVILAAWPAHDEVTARLMTRFHEQIALGRPAPSALRTAQLAVAETEPHPWFWATFTSAGAS